MQGLQLVSLVCQIPRVLMIIFPQHNLQFSQQVLQEKVDEGMLASCPLGLTSSIKTRSSDSFLAPRGTNLAQVNNPLVFSQLMSRLKLILQERVGPMLRRVLNYV
jgi:hypothetical protein